MTNFKGLSKIRKDRANEIKLETELINDYKNAISIHFNNVISEKDNKSTLADGKNGFYYKDFITSYSNNLNKQIKADSALCSIKELEIFNAITTDLLIEIVNFFIGIKNYDSKNNELIEGICLSKINIEDGFKKLGQFDIKIQDSLIEMKNYCLKVIRESINFLYNSLYIDIEKCKLKFDFKNLQDNFENSTSKVIINPDLNLINSSINNKKENLTLRQIALIYVYENNHITIENANEIAKKYNHNSGTKLLQHYTYFFNRSNTKSRPIPFTPKKTTNKIKLFEGVIEILPEKFKEKANDELKIIKNFLLDFE